MTALSNSLIWLAIQVTLFCLVGMAVYTIARRFGPKFAALVTLACLVVVAGLGLCALSPWPNWIPPIVERRPVSITSLAENKTDPDESQLPLDKQVFQSGDAVEPVATPGEENIQTVEPDESEPAPELTPPKKLNTDEITAQGAMSESEASPIESTDSSDESPSEFSSSLNKIMYSLWEELQQAPASAAPATLVESPSWSWREILTGLFLAGVALGVLRTLIGLLAVRTHCRRSREITDSMLHETVDILRAQLHCARAVTLRESSALPTAATVGWRRPMILLPEQWREWSSNELRTVIAHELAHIARNDFGARVIAQFGVMLQFYHPLVHWLAGKLRLEQELAADATAAELVGGGNVYLTSLAELALKQPNIRLGWPAQTFLPTRGMFLRRIEMLRNNKGRSERDAGGALAKLSQWCVVCVLLVAGLAVAGLRGAGEEKSSVEVAETAPPPRDEPHQTPKIGEVIERVVENDSQSDNAILDLDFGYFLAPAKSESQKLKDSKAEFFSWMRRTGADVLGDQHAKGGLLGFDVNLVAVSDADWRDATELAKDGSLRDKSHKIHKEMEEIFSRGLTVNPREFFSENKSKAKGKLPKTFMFQTREGSRGILQIVGYNEKPWGVKIRYLLLGDNGKRTARSLLEQPQVATTGTELSDPTNEEGKTLKMGDTDANRNALQFGKTNVRTLSDGRLNDHPFDSYWIIEWIDFDTDTVYKNPSYDDLRGDPNSLTGNDQTELMAEKGIDARGASSSNIRGLLGRDMIVIPATAKNGWDVTPRLLRESLSQGKADTPAVLSSKGKKLPATFWIQTREGSQGVLQITGFVKKPFGVNIRYKMLSKPEKKAELQQAAQMIDETAAPQTQTGTPIDAEPVREALPDETRFNFAHVPQNAAYVLAVRPAEILRDERFKPLAKELDQAASSRFRGIHASDIEQITIASVPELAPPPIEPTGVGTPNIRMIDYPGRVILHLGSDLDLEKLLEANSEMTKKEYKGQVYLAHAKNPGGPAYWMPNKRTLVKEELMELILLMESELDGDFKQLAGWGVSPKAQALFVFNDFTTVRQKERKELVGGPPLQMIAPLLESTEHVMVTFDILDQVGLNATVSCKTEEGAEQVEEVLKAVRILAMNMVDQQLGAVDAIVDKKEAASIRGILSLASNLLTNAQINTFSGRNVRLKSSSDSSPTEVSRLIQSTLEGIREVRLSSPPARNRENLKQIALGLIKYEGAHKTLPPPVLYGPDGKTPYSWRVAILPFIGEMELYERYRFDEPWDGPNNKKLLGKMPNIYRSPYDVQESTYTSYFVLVGGETVFPEQKGKENLGTRLAQITDGASNTLMVVEAKGRMFHFKDEPVAGNPQLRITSDFSLPVRWTKPVDIPFAADKPLPKLGGWKKDRYSVAFCDGHVRTLPQTMNKNILSAVITRAGTELTPQGNPYNVEMLRDESSWGRWEMNGFQINPPLKLDVEPEFNLDPDRIEIEP